jgi:pyruvate dehydrogenase E1 component
VAESQQNKTNGIEVLETREWLDSLDYVLSEGGPERAGRLLQHCMRAAVAG